MSRKNGRTKKIKNKLQQLDYLSEDSVVIDFRSSPHSNTDLYPPLVATNHNLPRQNAYRLKPKRKINFYLQ